MLNIHIWFMVFNATFTIFQLYRGGKFLLLLEETGVSRENHRPIASHIQTLSHNVTSSTPGPNSQL